MRLRSLSGFKPRDPELAELLRRLQDDLAGFSPGSGSGDMTKAVYDTDNDGVVDNAEKLGGKSADEFLDKETYDTDNDGVVDNAKKIDGRAIYVENRAPQSNEGQDGDIWIEYQE